MFLGFTIVNAQTVIQKDIRLEKIKIINFNLPYAKEINIKNWSEEFIRIKVEITIDGGQLDGQFQLNDNKKSQTLNVSSDYGSLFQKKKSFFSFLSNKDESTVIKLGKSENQDHVIIDGIRVKACLLYTSPSPRD